MKHSFRRRSRLAGLGVLAVGALIAGCSADSPPVTPPTNGLDLTPVVSQGNRATLGSTVTYTATVRNTGNTFSDGPVTMTVVLPVGHTMISATGSGWDCAAGSGGATVECTTSQVVNPPDSMPVVTIEANVGGALGLDSLYAAISTPGDVNRANDTTRGRVTTSPSGAGDQLYVQMAGVLQLRSGGVVSSGDVTVTSDILGPSALSIDATVGTTAVEANLTRLGGTLFTGPVTITDPSIQGGDPLELNWRGELAGIGERPFNNLSGTQLNLRIPSLDLPGISAAALNGITFSLGITAVDGQRQGVVHTYADGGLNIRPSINVPDRVVTGAPFTLDADLVAESGASIGAVSADIDLPSDVTFVGAGSGTTCVAVPAVQGRFRCSLNASVNAPISPNIVGRILGSFLPTGVPTISVRLQPEVAFTPMNISVAVDAGNSGVRRESVQIDARPPGPDVGITLAGPELTSSLWFAEGTGNNNNEYSIEVDNVGTVTSAPVTVTLELPAGITYRSFTTSGLTNANRFTCSAVDQTVTCTRPNGINVTSLLNPAPSLTVRVDVGSVAQVSATASVANPNDVDPTGPAKSATVTTRVALAGAPTFDVALTNGVFAASSRPVLDGGFTYTVNNGRLDGISGCGLSRDFTPAVLVVPVVGPTLVPAQHSDNRLCVNVTRVLNTNQFVGTASAEFVAPPVFIPLPDSIPSAVPVPPAIQPRPVSVSAATISAPTLNGDGSVSGSASGVSPELVLHGGATFSLNWTLRPDGVTCVDVNACP